MPLNGRIDLRSDTFTEPTHAMRVAMAETPVGDDIWELDVVVKELEAETARIFGKESGLFFPSSVMANLAALMAHTSGRGDEILVGDRSHISLYEQGNVSTIGGVHVRTLRNFEDGTFDLGELKLKIRPDNVHFPVTSLVCLETTHNMCGGTPIPLEFIRDVRSVVGGTKIHVDGARVFNATTALRIDPAEYLAVADSISLCLSKGLAAPIGSMLVGSSEFIQKARRIRKALGGGMRQVGVLAAPGLIAIREMRHRLDEDHANAKFLFHILSKINGVESTEPVTNILKFHLNPNVFPNISLGGLVALFQARNVYTSTVDEGRSIRAVTHYHITKEDVEEAGRVISEVLSRVAAGTLAVPEVARSY
jgi:threonine aldolase